MKKKSIAVGVIAALILLSFIVYPKELITSAANGLLVCGKIIIPSLFPFTALSLILFNSGFIAIFGKLIDPISKKIFGLNGNLFSIVIMSFIGGFPVGAKLVNQECKNNAISAATANRMLYYSVNPGPAFVIIGIGETMFQRADIGIIIYASNVISSLVLCMLCSYNEKNVKKGTSQPKNVRKNISDIFVDSVADASSSIISICGFVILFSTAIGILNTIISAETIKPIIALLEVSNGTIIYHNIYFLSFLTAFSGFCVHSQILSVCKSFKVKYFKFLFARILSGIISVLFTYLLIKILKPSITALAISNDYVLYISSNTIILSASLIFMSVTLLVSLSRGGISYTESKKL